MAVQRGALEVWTRCEVELIAVLRDGVLEVVPFQLPFQRAEARLVLALGSVRRAENLSLKERLVPLMMLAQLGDLCPVSSRAASFEPASEYPDSWRDHSFALLPRRDLAHDWSWRDRLL